MLKHFPFQISYLLFLGIFIYTLIFARPNKRDEYTEDQNTNGDWISGSRYSAFEIYLVLYVISTIPIEIIQVGYPGALRNVVVKLFLECDSSH